MTRTIVKTITAESVARSFFTIEYEDSQGEWLSAAGGWRRAPALRVNAEYKSPESAEVIARKITKLYGYRTRVVKFEGE